MRMKALGFCNDFYLFGNNLLWLQKQIFIKDEAFIIVEYHQFESGSCQQSVKIVFGIIALRYNVRGILTNHYTSYTQKTPGIIAGKIFELQEKIAYQLLFQ